MLVGLDLDASDQEKLNAAIKRLKIEFGKVAQYSHVVTVLIDGSRDRVVDEAMKTNILMDHWEEDAWHEFEEELNQL